MKDPERANLNATHLLQNALDEEDPELVAAAIEQGADVNALWDDQTLLSAAVQIGNIELIRLLLSAGADPNRKHPDGNHGAHLVRKRGDHGPSSRRWRVRAPRVRQAGGVLLSPQCCGRW
jgi:ankyrin repeat protein